MNNLIELNAWRNHRLQNQAEVDTDRMLYRYGDNEEGLVGTPTIISFRELASVEALREEIKEQQ